MLILNLLPSFRSRPDPQIRQNPSRMPKPNAESISCIYISKRKFFGQFAQPLKMEERSRMLPAGARCGAFLPFVAPQSAIPHVARSCTEMQENTWAKLR